VGAQRTPYPPSACNLVATVSLLPECLQMYLHGTALSPLTYLFCPADYLPCAFKLPSFSLPLYLYLC
jgi:hypothetical protein